MNLFVLTSLQFCVFYICIDLLMTEEINLTSYFSTNEECKSCPESMKNISVFEYFFCRKMIKNLFQILTVKT